jgi:Protein of unknown function (DUF1549)/Protein of unknown function (DUF1553)
MRSITFHFQFFASSRLCCFFLCAFAVSAAPLEIQYRGGATNLVLNSQDARQQLLATTAGDLDITREATWSAEPPGVVTIDKSGRVTPVADGSAVITAKAKDGATATLPVLVTNAAQAAPIHFANQIVPIFTKNGCNGGGCHGKAAGQNGFRLSLLGFEPAEDYEHLVKEARGRRLFPAAPERSLLLTKGTAQLPHGGGKRLEPGSDDYNALLRWIRQGMPVGKADAPTVTRIEVFPTERTLPLEAEQQLVVTAHYSDGSTEDVTRGALFEPNDKDMAKTDALGRVKVFNQPGEVAVMVRYQGKVAVFRGTVPLGAPVESLPLAKTFVDELVFKQLKKVGMPPSDVADDATFLRRVTIDIAGRLPTSEELEALRKDASPNKRDAVIDRLLGSTDYADYFANTWSALLRNKRNDAKQAHGTYAFHDWIRDSLQHNKPYDQFVREIVAASGDLAENPPVAWYRQVRTLQNQLEDTAQLFLGLRLQCAQCHHHPYERWSQADYWSFGAFFSQVSYKPGSQPGEDSVVHRRGTAQATNKKNGRQVKPAGLGETPLVLSPDDDPRQSLADWLTRPDNRFFARALVNRYWKHFFNRGLVDPEDDMRDTNPATNPELLDALAADFVKSGYDLKHLVRTLTRSAVYQLSATPNQYNARDRHHFARYYPRRLNAEVLYDAVNTMLATESKFDGLPAGTRAVALPDNSFNAGNYFLTVFGRPESSSACECERSMDASLSQSLHLLNAKDIQDRLAADASRAARLALEPARPDDVKLRDLYRLAYARDPQPEELKVGVEYVAKKAAAAKDDPAKTKARREAYEDTLWALLNTKEFLFNH